MKAGVTRGKMGLPLLLRNMPCTLLFVVCSPLNAVPADIDI